MDQNARHFARLFRVELEDIIEDIKLLIDRTEKRFENDEITPYVRMENKAFLQREVEAIEKFMALVDVIDLSIYKGTADIEAAFLEKSRDFVSRLEDPEAVYVLLKRKLEKVSKFISPDNNDSAP
ncbi:MAG: hypothetical protein A2Y38_06760 [Spirochaetes bacterium GWB1_59_5]|nr:MAG: hypothetical protein A2Y38_06760 [Spirochaetes bacterium GWB1_59_5]